MCDIVKAGVVAHAQMVMDCIILVDTPDGILRVPPVLLQLIPRLHKPVNHKGAWTLSYC